MLFWIFVILTIGSIVWVVIDGALSEWCNIYLTVGFMSAICFVVSLFIIGFNHINVDGYIDQMNVRHDSLVYQYENDIYENDNDLGKRELMTDIQNWNEDLARLREAQDDFWIGIYRPNIYDQFEFIELERQEVEQND